jgi:RNA polymerase-binding protein DksA
MSPTPSDINTQLDEFRSLLLAQRRRLFGQVAHLEDDLRWLEEDIESEVVEEGQEETIARLLTRLDERGRSEIEAIDHALERIDRGEYGLCAVCGEAIPLARQRAVPTADTCLSCARTREERARR